MSQSSPGSLTGASSADATVMTMPTGSQVSGEGKVAPPELIAAGSDARTVNAKRALRRFTRSTSPRTNTAKSPKRSIERVEIEDAKGIDEREILFNEELLSARVSYQYLHDEYSCLHAGYTSIYSETREELSQLTRCNKAMRYHLQEMMQEDEGATLNESFVSLSQWQITFTQSMKSLLEKAMKNIRSSMR